MSSSSSSPYPIYSEWMCGNPSGNISLRGSSYQVRFPKMKSKCFSVKNYDSLEAAYEAALDYRREISDTNNLTKNRIRFVTQSNGETYVEMELQIISGTSNHYVAKLDLDDLDYTEGKGSWYADIFNDRPYMRRSSLFHRMLYPEWSEIDHINRDGLDNRRQNLRDGSKGVNASNRSLRCDSSSGVNGVNPAGDRGWKATWQINGKQHIKYFAFSEYGSKELAFEAAVIYRKSKDLETGCTNGYNSDDAEKSINSSKE